MVVGAKGDDTAGGSAGAVYTYTWNGRTWGNQQVIRPSGLEQNDLFGFSVSISGDKMVVGALGDSGVNNSKSAAGAVYTFVWDGTTWGNQQIIRPSGLDANDGFGYNVAISGDKMAVNVPYDDGVNNALINSGAVYTYTWNGTSWGNEQVIRPSGLDESDQFGSGGVSISGDRMVVGAIYDDGVNNALTNSGAVYTYIWNGTSWGNEQLIRGSGLQAFDLFGNSVSISGDKMVVSAHRDDGVTNTLYDSGTVYTYTWNGTSWGNEQVIRASDPRAGAYFGESVSISGNKMVVGASQYDSKRGGVYLFNWNGTIWEEERFIQPINGLDSSDQFGKFVSISGNKLVVGAFNDDGLDNFITNSGVVYTFLL